jgi:hypothetical protein
MTQIPEFRNYIAGEWIRSSSGATFENHNPANRNDGLGNLPEVNRQRRGSRCRCSSRGLLAMAV